MDDSARLHLANHHTKTDIVYNDTNFPVEGTIPKYL